MTKLDSYWENGKNSNLNPKFGWQGNRFPIRRGVTIRMNNKNHSCRDSNIRLYLQCRANSLNPNCLWEDLVMTVGGAYLLLLVLAC